MAPRGHENPGFEFPLSICLHCAFWRIIAVVSTCFSKFAFLINWSTHTVGRAKALEARAKASDTGTAGGAIERKR